MTKPTGKSLGWDEQKIANGILTWYVWPEFQGTYCRQCGCEMNVQGMSYGHKCPDCDPNRQGHLLSMEISENQRKYAVGIRIMIRDYYNGYGEYPPTKIGTIIEWAVGESYPGMRYYRVNIDNGQQFKLVLESNLAPFRKFSDKSVFAGKVQEKDIRPQKADLDWETRGNRRRDKWLNKIFE